MLIYIYSSEKTYQKGYHFLKSKNILFIVYHCKIFFLSTKLYITMEVCPICLDPLPLSIFTNTICGHVWCKCCHNKMIKHNISTCPMCRTTIALKRRPPKNQYIEWLLEGGEPVIRWRRKRSDKYFNRYYKY